MGCSVIWAIFVVFRVLKKILQSISAFPIVTVHFSLVSKLCVRPFVVAILQLAIYRRF